MFQDCFKVVSRLLQGYLKGISSVPTHCFKVSQVFQGFIKEVAKVLLEYFRCVAKEVGKCQECEECFKGS